MSKEYTEYQKRFLETTKELVELSKITKDQFIVDVTFWQYAAIGVMIYQDKGLDSLAKAAEDNNAKHELSVDVVLEYIFGEEDAE